MQEGNTNIKRDDRREEEAHPITREIKMKPGRERTHTHLYNIVDMLTQAKIVET